ncbi:MAG: phage tail protein I [Desulfovibrio sp.]
MPNLLPPNATKLEAALADGISRLSSIPVPIRDTWNPDTCPKDLLPWLAWALSVDHWDSSWSEEQQRQAVKESVWIHRHKGTRGAVNRAVSALGYKIQIKEWFEQEPQGAPGTFSVDIEVDDRGVTPVLLSSITSTVMTAKNVRSHLSGLNMALASRGSMKIGGAVTSGSVLTVMPWYPKNHDLSGSLFMGGVCASYTTITVHSRS